MEKYFQVGGDAFLLPHLPIWNLDSSMELVLHRIQKIHNLDSGVDAMTW